MKLCVQNSKQEVTKDILSNSFTQELPSRDKNLHQRRHSDPTSPAY